MKAVFYLLVICLSFAALATNGVETAAAGKTNLVIKSDTMESLGWSMQTLFGTPDGKLIDNSGKVASHADAAAIEAAAEAVGEISLAVNAEWDKSINRLNEAVEGMAKYARGYALAIAPEKERVNLTGFVVAESSDGTNDTQWVWYNYEMRVAPVRWVEYAGDFETQTVKAVWADWTAKGEEKNGWSGVHKCTVKRPTWARGVPCVTKPNEIFGSNNGFTLGAAVLTLDGKPPFTGYVTNAVYGVVEYYDQGIMIERSALQ